MPDKNPQRGSRRMNGTIATAGTLAAVFPAPVSGKITGMYTAARPSGPVFETR
ncbi:hypothetical protein [Nocardia sp.]|uniref:hypothetical protein n=1 Tax=Nocardia sp. TaxID=1821 RepID=UPI0026381136|nr:hypothetical protein [Nocardia sp.]